MPNRCRFDDICYLRCFMIILICTSTLQSLQLCCIGITTVDDEAFQGLDSLRVLRLHSDHLTVGPSLQHIRNITHLYLYKNLITNLPHDYFAGCVSLAGLSLENNHLVSLPDMTHVAQSLQFVVLADNRLMFSDAFERVPWPELKSLALSGNAITSLEISLLENAKSRRLLNLKRNELRTLPDLTQFKMFQNTSHTLTIWLEENPWHCNAELPTVPEFPGHVTGRVEKLRNTDDTSNITEITSFVEIYSWMLISHIRLIFSSVSAPKLTFNM